MPAILLDTASQEAQQLKAWHRHVAGEAPSLSANTQHKVEGQRHKTNF